MRDPYCTMWPFVVPVQACRTQAAARPRKRPQGHGTVDLGASHPHTPRCRGRGEEASLHPPVSPTWSPAWFINSPRGPHGLSYNVTLLTTPPTLMVFIIFNFKWPQTPL